MPREDRNTAIYAAYDDITPSDEAGPEKNLLAAILLSALSDLRKPGEAGRKALEFFLSPEEDYVFSFVSICDYLSLDPKLVLAVAGLKPAAKRSRINGEALDHPDADVEV